MLSTHSAYCSVYVEDYTAKMKVHAIDSIYYTYTNYYTYVLLLLKRDCIQTSFEGNDTHTVTATMSALSVVSFTKSSRPQTMSKEQASTVLVLALLVSASEVVNVVCVLVDANLLFQNPSVDHTGTGFHFPLTKAVFHSTLVCVFIKIPIV